MNRWNNADTTLLVAAILFLIAALAQSFFPESKLAEGFLFVTEAAMVGGIADWFAVTALFKRPLGFPFHTAILPNRRAEFIEASTTMVQQEFFSRRTLFKKVGAVKLVPKITAYLEKPETRKFILEEIAVALKKYIASLDREAQAKAIAATIRREFGNVPAKDLIREGGAWIRSSGKDVEVFVGLVKKLREIAVRAETRAKLQEMLEEFAAQRTQSAGLFTMLMAGLAQTLNYVNYGEAAEIMQAQLVKMLDELLTDSPLRRKTLEECRAKISELAETQDFRDLFERVQVDLAAELPLEATIDAALANFQEQIQAVNFSEDLPVAQEQSESLGEIFMRTLIDLYSQLIYHLKVDSQIKTAAEKFIYELTVRAAIYAQPLVGKIASTTLSRMTVDQLNSLVYDKAEPDFVWIRMNGSIVGSIVGAVIFLVINIVT
ncbi:MAG: DUF445 domain-containing protein [Selenomonadaceae bacterium]|nr:DUF445 domain-containing protein [Selenomonadaceae bacterium]